MSLENPMPGAQTPPAGAGQSSYPAYPGYPAYGPYPYPYYGHAGMPLPTAPIVPVLPPVPARAPDRPWRQRTVNVFIAVVLAAATVGALALAAAAPAFVARDPGPLGGSTQVYSSSLRSDSTNWDTTNGCTFEDGGLHATNESAPTTCLFTPSHQTDYTSGGFYLTTHIAPPGAVASTEGACVVFSTATTLVTFAVDQNGAYALLTNPTDPCSTSPDQVGQIQQDTAAWHGDGLVANDLSISYDANGRVLTVYLNGQQILQQGFLFSERYDISLGTAANDEALYTAFGLWSQSPAGAATGRD